MNTETQLSHSLTEISYTAVVEVTGGREGHARSSDGALDVKLQRPAQVGTGAGGTNPEQLFAAGYSACLQSALLGAASRAGYNVSKSVFTSRVSIGKTEVGGYGLAVVFDILIPGLDQATAEDLVAQAHAGCPYSNATRGNIDVTLNVTTS